jgi:hypothetical protein
MGEDRQLTVGAGDQQLHALIGSPRRQAGSNLRVGQDPEGMLGVIEQARRVEHLEARLQADKEAARRAADLDRAEGDALHHRRNLAELVRRIDLYLDAPAGAPLDARFHRLEKLVRDIVDGRERQFHRELLGTRRRYEKAGCHDAKDGSTEPAGDRMHVYFPL